MSVQSKRKSGGTGNKYKARLVAKGFLRQLGYDYNETLSLVSEPITIRILLTLAITQKWSLKQLDVNNALINRILEEDIYMTQPPGFEISNKHIVCKLHKAIYGLKQAPRSWFERLKATLLHFHFKSSKCDPSFFIYIDSNNIVVYMLVYVDDIIITENNSSFFKSLVTKLNSEFSLKDLRSLDYFLGIEVKSQPNGVPILTQSKFIRDLLSKTKMDEANPISSPSCKLTKSRYESFPNPTHYRSVMGALQYATITKAKIGFFVNKVYQYISNPTKQH